MNKLALDLSTKASGWAVRTDDIQLESGVITSSSTIVEKRITIMRDEVLKLIQKYDIKEIIVEEVHAEYAGNSHVNQVLNWLQGCLRVAVFEYDKKINIKTILPNSWRSKIGIKVGKGITRATLKQKDIEYVAEKYGKIVGDDEADAIGILDSDEIVDKKLEEFGDFFK